MRKKIKIYGERNTGTNYLNKLIDINFECELLKGTVPTHLNRLFIKLSSTEWLKDSYFQMKKSNLGWKHRELDAQFLKSLPDSTAITFITLTKNPYSWLLSMYKRPYHFINKNITFDQFLTEKCIALGRECDSGYYDSPVDLWNKKNRSYINLAQNFETELLTYEDLLITPLEQLKKLKSKFDLTVKEEFPINYDKSTKDEDKNSNYYLEYYGKELWKSKLSLQSINIINDQLAADVMNYFKYKLI